MACSSRSMVLITHQDALLAAGIAATLAAVADEFEVVRPNRGQTETALTQAWVSCDLTVADYDTAVEQMKRGAPAWPVLILTQETREARVRKALELGVRGYLLVGCSAAELIESIRIIRRGGSVLARIVTERLAESLRTEPLTKRQRAVLRELLNGLSNKDIARRLCLTEGTVKSHMKAVLTKLNASSRTEAVAIAQRRGIASDPEPASRQPRSAKRIVNNTTHPGDVAEEGDHRRCSRRLPADPGGPDAHGQLVKSTDSPP
jgi:DNA-binding NarL/FixJ family response regulator